MHRRYSALQSNVTNQIYAVALKSTSSKSLFLSMTTEKEDFTGLTINEGYGLTIRHRDGRAEEARSAGAEHVVALALMGALQRNAPLRGPIVMDSPFGRLDEDHTANVVRTFLKWPNRSCCWSTKLRSGRIGCASCSEAGSFRSTDLERVSARRTNVREVK